MKKIQLKVKHRNFKSHSPRKRAMNGSISKMKSNKSIMFAQKTSTKHPTKRKFQLKIPKSIINSKKALVNSDLTKIKSRHKRKLIKGVSDDHEHLKDEKINNRLFDFEFFGDASSPTTFQSRRCKMDLTKIISDDELELMKTNILQDMSKNMHNHQK